MIFEGELVVSIAKDVARGMAYLSSHGIIHYDLKPDNVLLFPAMETSGIPACKICDFGFEKSLGIAMMNHGTAVVSLAMSSRPFRKA